MFLDRMYYENKYKEEGFEVIAGVDEAGRGACAGPLFAAAVVLDETKEIDGLKDSKKLSAQKREALFLEIQAKAKAFAIVAISVDEIEEKGIAFANHKALTEALKSLSVKPQFAIVDYVKLKKEEVICPFLALAKADDLSASVAAASILAKVARDQYMKSLDAKYPDYVFSKHKGYGTKVHKEKLLLYGPCSEHRLQFVKTLLSNKEKLR